MDLRKRTRAQCRTRQETFATTTQFSNERSTKRSFRPPPQQIVCNFCKKSGHAKRNYRRANRLCLACGSGDHIINDCVFRRTRNTIPVSSALSVPHIRDPVRLMCTLKATNHISLLFSRFNLFFSGQFNHFLPTLFVTIARRPVTHDETIEWLMDYVWPVAPMTIR